MNRILLPAAIVLSLAGSVAFAQQPTPAQSPAPVVRHHEHDPHKTALKMSKELNLTADQTAKVEPILVASNQKLTDLQANNGLDAKGLKKQMKAIHQDTEQQLAGVLTPDQMTQLKAMHQHEHGKHKQTQPLTPPASPTT